MVLSMIAAVSENGVIGRDGDLPWRLPDDMRWFRRTTMGHPIIMGRRTYRSNGGPLAGRTNIVVSTTMDAKEGVRVVASLDDAIEAARRCEGGEEVFIIGGARLYEEGMRRCDRLYLSRVHATVEGDTFFPPVDWDEWELVRMDRHERDDRHEHAFSMCVYERRRGGS